MEGKRKFVTTLEILSEHELSHFKYYGNMQEMVC